MRRLLRSAEFLVLVGLLVLAVAYQWHYAPQLPDRVPTHFDARGMADDWSSRDTFVLYYWGILGGLSVVFLLTAWGMLKIPAPMLNLPHRQHWLSPEREERTRLDLAKRFLRLANATVVFDLVLTHLSVKAALSGEESLGEEFNWILGAFLVYVAVWIGLLLWRYSRDPA